MRADSVAQGELEAEELEAEELEAEGLEAGLENRREWVGAAVWARLASLARAVVLELEG